MRKLWLLLAFAGLAMAAEEGAGKKPEGDFLLEKWVNFAILAAGLGYVAVKQGGPVFRARKLEITESLEVSRRRAEAAAERAAEVDRRMAGLQADVEALRAEALVGMQAEGQRIGAETAEKMVKLGQADGRADPVGAGEPVCAGPGQPAEAESIRRAAEDAARCHQPVRQGAARRGKQARFDARGGTGAGATGRD